MILRILVISIYTFFGLSLIARDTVSVHMTVPGHPRLFLLKNEGNVLLNNIRKDAVWMQLHESIIYRRNLLIFQPWLFIMERLISLFPICSLLLYVML